MGGGIERVLIVFFINLIAVLGIGIYSGNSGILSFGHLAFMGIAAYLSGILTMPVEMKQMTLANLPAFLATPNLDLLTASVVSVIFVMLVALAVGIVIMRLDGSAATIATLAFLIIVHGLIIGARDITRGSQSFFGVPRETDLMVAAIGATIAIIVARFFRDSVPGLRLRASRDDTLAAGAMGVDVRQHRLLAWVISAGVVAIAGVLLGHFLGAFSAKKFYFVDTFMLIAMLVVGGMATVSGALAGTILITLVTEILRRLEGGGIIFGLQMPELFGMTQIGIGLIILFVMYRMSGGLLGGREWDEILFKGRGSQLASTIQSERVHEPNSSAEFVEARSVEKVFGNLLSCRFCFITIEERGDPWIDWAQWLRKDHVGQPIVRRSTRKWRSGYCQWWRCYRQFIQQIRRGRLGQNISEYSIVFFFDSTPECDGVRTNALAPHLNLESRQNCRSRHGIDGPGG